MTEKARQAAESWLAQLDKELKKIAAPIAEELREMIHGDKNAVRVSALTRAISLGMLNAGSDLNTVLARAFGHDFSVSYDTQRKLADTQRKLVELEAKGLGAGREATAHRHQQLVLLARESGLGPRVYNVVASSIRASMYSGLSTIGLSFFAGGLGTAGIFTEEFLRTGFEVARNKDASFAEEFGSLFGAVFNSLGLKARFVHDKTPAELRKELRVGPLDYTATDFMLGTKPPGAIVLHSDGIAEAGGRQEIVDISDLHRLWVTAEESLTGLKGKKWSKRDVATASKNLVQLAVASQEVVWRTLGGIDGAAISTIESMIEQFNLLRLVRDGRIPRNDFKRLQNQMAGVAQSHFEAVREDNPEVSARAARVFVREAYDARV